MKNIDLVLIDLRFNEYLKKLLHFSQKQVNDTMLKGTTTLNLFDHKDIKSLVWN